MAEHPGSGEALRVCLATEATTRDLDTLQAGLPRSVQLVPQDHDHIDVLVTGRPSQEALQRVRRALVVPYSGLPASTRRLLLSERPELPVYNLHHNAQAVAEMALALALSAAKLLLPMDSTLRSLDWRPRYAPDPALPLAGGDALIVGYGAIGRRLHPALAGLGMKVQAVRRERLSGDPPWLHGQEALPELLDDLRLLVLCLPHTPETTGLFDAELLARLPSSACLVNVGRSGVLDEQALFAALSEGRLHSAGIDVWSGTPRSPEERVGTAPSPWPFHTLDNVVLSPHRAGHGAHVEHARMTCLAELLGALAADRPPPPVDLLRGY